VQVRVHANREVDIESQLKDAKRSLKRLESALVQANDNISKLTLRIAENETQIKSMKSIDRILSDEEKGKCSEIAQRLIVACTDHTSTTSPINATKHIPSIEAYADNQVVNDFREYDKSAMMGIVVHLLKHLSEVSKVPRSSKSDNLDISRNNTFTDGHKITHFFHDDIKYIGEDSSHIHSDTVKSVSTSPMASTKTTKLSPPPAASIPHVNNSGTTQQSNSPHHGTTALNNTSIAAPPSIQLPVGLTINDLAPLWEGVTVLKHGRLGSRKERKLTLSRDTLILFWEHVDVQKLPSGRNLNEFIK
jgi:hypothetical protein